MRAILQEESLSQKIKQLESFALRALESNAEKSMDSIILQELEARQEDLIAIYDLFFDVGS